MPSTVEPSRLPYSNPPKRREVESRSDGSLPSSSSSSSHSSSTLTSVPWRSESQRRIYSAKLFEALFRARNRFPTDSPREPSAGGDVRGIADRVLATAAKGRTRWSRAILSSRRSRAGKRRVLRRARVPAVGGSRLVKEGRAPGTRSRSRMLPAVEKRVKVLGRLVPGCRGVSVTSLLEEATDYIAALEMQVKAMAALSQLLGRGTTPSQ
ncbi:hypothetical protein MLD38_016807 [Melastoma candidum]|uniref:Uncharacterized protein n=1 Tax=Melastoma candidum TaxID=119954 RepID=A0ACB9QRQ4_9MYRT|nr:hypothetical protein MLD38_016807 [Melastoma candidum]